MLLIGAALLLWPYHARSGTWTDNGVTRTVYVSCPGSVYSPLYENEEGVMQECWRQGGWARFPAGVVLVLAGGVVVVAGRRLPDRRRAQRPATP